MSAADAYDLTYEVDEDRPSSGQWCLAAEDDQVYRLIVQYSKSGRAKCRKCSEKIANKELRIGKPIKWRGFISSWTHVKCYWNEVEDESNFRPIKKEEIFGFKDLTAADKKAVLKQVKEFKPPDGLESITPDDPGFTKRGPLERVKQPKSVVLELLPFQEEGFGWMKKQEESALGGGILADEMGMGKTIQTIAVIASDKEKKKKKKSGGPTLIVSPSSAMLQWKLELERCTSPGLLKVLVYHGQVRSKLTPAQVLEHDVVLTTYPTLESGYRACVNLAKVPCDYCNKMFLPRKLVLHNKYFCGPNARRTKRLAKTDRSNGSNTAVAKAMRTLGITKEEDAGRHSLPTPGNVYRELMRDANRTAVGMYETKERAAELQKAKENEKQDDAMVKEEEDDGDDEEEEAKPLDLRSLWVVGDGEMCMFKSNLKERSYWFSNLRATSADGSPHLLFTEAVNERTSDHVVLNNKKLDLKVKLESSSVLYSMDDGESWSKLVSPSRKELKGRWVLGEDVDLTNLSQDHEFVGHPVARNFDGRWFLGLVVAHYDGEDEEFWRVCHWDGDVEDLSLQDLKKAMSRKCLKEALQEGPQNMRKRRVTVANDSRLSLACVLSPSKRPRKRSAAAVRKKTNVQGNDAESGSEYVEESSEDSSGSDFEDSNGKAPKRRLNRKKTQSSSDEEAEEIDEPAPLPAKFVPATWDETSPFYARLRASWKSKSGKKRKATRKKRRRKKKTGSKSKGSGKNGKGTGGGKKLDSSDSDFEPPKKKKASGSGKERKSPRKVTKKTRKVVRDSSDSESESESSSSEESAQEVIQHSGPFFYANAGDVVDDDGIDLGMSLLHCIAWKRVVLDEAHKIKDRVNSTAKSTFSLRGDPKLKGAGTGSGGGLCHRWCLTGTPMQNRVAELYSLVRFLRFDPYAYYNCNAKDCDCKSLNWTFGPMSRRCLQCGHPPMKHFSYFNKHIMNPIKRIGYTGEGRTAMILLRDDLLRTIMLRRTKSERQEDIRLPELKIQVAKLQLSEAERDFYESVYKNTRSKFDTFVKKGTLLHNYAHIFQLLSRLRRSADHPYLVIHGKNSDDSGAEYSFPSESTKRSDICGICHFDIDSLQDCALSQCRHTFHKSCIKEILEEKTGEGEEEKKTKGSKRKTKPKTKKKGKAKAKKGESNAPGCPVCFQPLSLTLDVNNQTFAETMPSTEDDSLCIICFDRERDALLTPCGHLYSCTVCIRGLKQKKCPMCRVDIDKVVKVDQATAKSASGTARKEKRAHNVSLIGRRSMLQKINVEKFASSSKIDAVVNEVRTMQKLELKAGEDPHKAIIFSQYTDMIDLVEWKLRNAGIRTVKLVGSMPVSERESVLNAFRDTESEKQVPVILMSLKAGGEGLNLQVASHVMILETWWNPQVHNQAFQRAHRIGQKRDVKAILFVTEETIEEKMHQLQEKKQLIFEGAIDGSATAMQQLNPEDLRFLFS